MDHVPFCSEWDLEKPRAEKGLDPFTQPPHRQAGRAPCRRESSLEGVQWKNGTLSSCKGSYYHTHTFALPCEYLGVVYFR